MQPTIFAQACALYGRSVALGVPIFPKPLAGYDEKAAMVVRAAVDAQQVGDGWVGDATGDYGQVVAAFFPTLQPDSALVKAIFRQLTVDTPLNVAIAAALTNVSAYQQGQGIAIPVTRFALNRRLLAPATLDALLVAPKELLVVPGAAELMQIMLQQGCGAIVDAYFHNQMADSNTASYDASGTSATNFFADLKKLFGAVFPAGTSTARAFFVTGSDAALQVSCLTDTTGALVMPSMGVSGGLIMGVPAFVSPGWPADKITLLNGSRICTGLDNTIGLAASQETVIQMDNAPTEDAGQGTGSTSVSVFQVSAAAIKISMRLAVERAVDSAVAEVTSTNYL